MLVLGHLGIGSKLVNPWTRELPKAALFLGMLLPDIIDKPLYYGLVMITGKHSAELGLISSTRTFGHTSILLLVITGVAVLRRSKGWAALALGMATHLFLDNLSDTLTGYFDTNPVQPGERSALVALLWPFLKNQFSASPFANLAGHMAHSFNGITMGAEVVGAAILGWDYWKNRHESEIMQMLQFRRRQHKVHKRRAKVKPTVS